MLSRMLTSSAILLRNVSNYAQPKERERKNVGAQRLAYQASCREREATHRGPIYFILLKQVLYCGSPREKLRAGNRHIVCDCPKYAYSKVPKCCEGVQRLSVVMHSCVRDVRCNTGIKVHINRYREDAYTLACKLAVVPFIKL